jgi:hypothetical protein
MLTATQPTNRSGGANAPFRTGHNVHREQRARTRTKPDDFEGPKAHPIRGVSSRCTVTIRY